jgi:MFS family permease
MKWRNIFILTLSQALGMSGLPLLILLGGIIGAELAPSPILATLPLSISVTGVALATIPGALLVRRVGRRRGFIAGSLFAVGASLLGAYSVAVSSFWLFCLAAGLLGVNAAIILQYRFAAAESAPPHLGGRAVSFVLLGGIAAGYLGPEIAARSRAWTGSDSYSSAFLILAGVYLVVALLLLFLRDIVPQDETGTGPERPLRAVFFQPAYLTAVLAAVVAYGVMSLVMTATPVYMHTMHGFSLEDTAWVIQSHIIAMYLPSLFSGYLLDRIGGPRVMGLGLLALFITVFLGFISRELVHFWGALVLLGVGWNFLFIGSTLLLTASYRPAERFKAQAANDFSVFGVQALSSLSAGSLLYLASWNTLLWVTVPFLLLTTVAVLLLYLRPQRFALPAPERT